MIGKKSLHCCWFLGEVQLWDDMAGFRLSDLQVENGRTQDDTNTCQIFGIVPYTLSPLNLVDFFI